MMFHFPYLGFPYQTRYSRYGYHYPYYTYNYSTNHEYSSKNTVSNTSKTTYKNQINKAKMSNKEKTNKDTKIINSNISNSNTDFPKFQLFGINLYFDDILLICLIWFLYSEEVKDEGLFIALILLLLS